MQGFELSESERERQKALHSVYTLYQADVDIILEGNYLPFRATILNWKRLTYAHGNFRTAATSGQVERGRLIRSCQTGNLALTRAVNISEYISQPRVLYSFRCESFFSILNNDLLDPRVFGGVAVRHYAQDTIHIVAFGFGKGAGSSGRANQK